MKRLFMFAPRMKPFREHSRVWQRAYLQQRMLSRMQSAVFWEQRRQAVSST